MPYPEYIPTRVVSIGGAAVLESGALLKVQVSVVSSRSLVWDATGYRFERGGIAVQSELGSEIQLILPRTDVPGWKDASTGAVLDVSADDAYSHRYTATVAFADANDRTAIGAGRYEIGPFVVPEGEGVIDLDKMVPASTIAGDAISIPDLWGQLVADAQAAASDAQAALVDSDTFIASQITTPGTETETALRGTIDGEIIADVERTVAGAWRFGRAPSLHGAAGAAIDFKSPGDTRAGAWNLRFNGDFGYGVHAPIGPDTTPGTFWGAIGGDWGYGGGWLFTMKAGGVGIEAIGNPSMTAPAVLRVTQWSKSGRGASFDNKVGVNPVAFFLSKGEGFSDGATSLANPTKLTSATANFAVGDVGSVISQTTSRGEGFVIPSGTTIIARDSATQVTLSQPVTGNASGINFQISTRSPASSQKWVEFYDQDGVIRAELAPNLFKLVGQNLDVRANTANPPRVFGTANDLRFYQYNAGGSNYWATYLQASGGTFRIRSYAPAGVGSESTFTDMIRIVKDQIGFFGATPVGQPTISGSRGGNAALAALLTFLASRGDIIDGTTA